MLIYKISRLKITDFIDCKIVHKNVNKCQRLQTPRVHPYDAARLYSWRFFWTDENFSGRKKLFARDYSLS
jgi:hypothetical protein